MKSFKQFLLEDKNKDEEDRKINAAYLNVNSLLNPYNPNWQTDMYLANTINPRDSMPAEEAWNTDVAMAFDLSPDGELIADPEGFKAVHRRTKENRNIKFSPPPTMRDIRERIWKEIRTFGGLVRENYDSYLDDLSQFRPDGTRKGKGWLGPFKNSRGEDVSEYSISVPTEELLDLNLPRGTILHKPETHIPTLVPDLTDEEIESVIRSTETGENLTNEVINKAFSHARNKLQQGQSQYR